MDKTKKSEKSKKNQLSGLAPPNGESSISVDSEPPRDETSVNKADAGEEKAISDRTVSVGISEETFRRIPDSFKTEASGESNEKATDKNSDNAGENKAADLENGRPTGDFRPGPPHFDRDHRPPGMERPRPHVPTTRSNVPPFLIIAAIIFGIGLFYSSRMTPKVTSISWNGFCSQLDAKNVESVNIRGNILSGTFRQIPFGIKEDGSVDALIPDQTISDLLPGDQFREKNGTSPLFRLEKRDAKDKAADKRTYEIFLIYPEKKTKESTGVFLGHSFRCEIPNPAYADPNLDERIRSKVDSYTSTTPTDNSGYFMLFSIILSVVILIVFWRMMRRTNEQIMGGGGLQGFSKSPMRRYDPNGPQVTFNDVAGLENVKKELMEIVDFLKNPEKYRRMGARVPKGTLLFGPPGTGKTLLGRAVAGEAHVPFFSINGSEFMQMFVGVGASRVRELFNTAKENAPCILFIDEIDAVGRQRGTGLGGGHDEREQTLNQILSEMDGFVPTESVMVMAATNRPDVLDPALMRPGRFDRHITVDRPSLKGRIEIFEVYLKKVPKADDVDAEKLARATVGFTGADIQNLVNEAALWATRNDKSVIDQSDFEFAHAKVIMGLAREETISEANKRKTAYHEAGHTIIDWFSPTNTRVHKVTIVPRGRSLGATYILPEEDQLNVNETEIKSKLAEYLAGRAAERMIYRQTSTGAENDLKEATQLARRMVVHWGMSDRLGPIAFRSTESNPFLGREIAEMREYSDATARLIDEEVIRILREADESANKTLTEKRDFLDKLTDALVEEEELDQTRLTEILGPAAEAEDEGEEVKREN